MARAVSAPPPTSALAANPYSVAVGDFNGDGKQDLAVANGDSNNVSILLGDGAGNFSAATNFGAGIILSQWRWAISMAMASKTSPWPTTAQTTCRSCWAMARAVSAPPPTSALALVLPQWRWAISTAMASKTSPWPTSSSNNVSILLGDGAGSFSAATNFGAGSYPSSVAVGDFNGDGKQDLAVANQGSNNVSILLRRCCAPTPNDGYSDLPQRHPKPTDRHDPPTQRQHRPGLGNYPDTSIPLSTDTTVTPDAAPTNTTSINVSTSTNFKGRLEGYPTTGVVRVTDAHPAGTYTVTVTAFERWRATTKTFTLTVTTPATCNPVSFAAAANFGAGSIPRSSGGRFQRRWQARPRRGQLVKQRVDLVGRWRGPFQRRHQLRRRRSSFSSGGRFQWRWQARPRRGQLWLKQRVDLVGRWRGQFQRRHQLRRWQ